MPSRKILPILPLLLIVASCNRDPRVQAQRYVDNGNKFYAKGKYKEAAIMYRKAIQKDLRFGEAYYRMGLTDMRMYAYGDAVRELRRAVELQPENADAATKLADIFLTASLHDPARAADLFKEIKELTDRLLRLDPNSFDAHRLKGTMAYLSKDPTGAIVEYEKANAVKPYQPELIMAYFQALILNDRVDDAEKLAREMINRQKNFSPMYDLLYLQYMRLNRSADAEKLLKLKAENNPQKASYLMQVAMHYYTVNRRSDMEAIFEKLNDDKKYPEGHMLVGDFFFFRAREFDHAQQQYEAAIKAFPKDRAVYQKRMVELYAATKRNNEASALLATILKDNPKDNDAIAMRASLMLTSGSRDQINLAANDLQALVTKMPQNHLLRFNLARALAAKGEIEQARLQLEQAIKIRPDFIVARELLARIYLSRNEAVKGLKEADEIIGYDKNHLQAHLLRSLALLHMGDKDRAREELAFITKTFPQNAEARYQIGFLAWQEKDYKKAEQVFGDLYRANPNDFRGMAGLVETLASEKRTGEAIRMVQEVSARSPERQDLKLALANLYVRSERFDEAIQMFKALHEKNPKAPDILFRLAETQRYKGDLNGSMESYRQCTQIAPNDTTCLMQLALLMDGTGKRDQAKPIYEQVLKVQPDHAIALNNLAYIKAEEGTDLDAALTMAQRAKQKLPNAPDIADTLGWIYIKKSLSDNAIQVFRDLTTKQPNNPTFHYHFGMALLQKGDKPGAKKELEKALLNKPSKDEEGKIKDLLAKT